MKWTVRIALSLPLVAGLAAIVPLSKAPAGDLCPVVNDVVRCNGIEVLKRKTPGLLVNTRKLRLNYNVSEVGPSGVSSVELWATRDGKSWQRYSNEPPPSGPLCVHVAEEGKYGFSLVVKNGLGIASPAPRVGDAPQLWVTVDETAPTVHLAECAVAHGDSMVIGWTAHDAHLADSPISISTAVSKEGPWTTVVAGLPNTGRHVWKMPRDLPFEFYVKVEASDVAGNVGGEYTSRPIRVDLCKPRGTITGVENEKKFEVRADPVTPQVLEFTTGITR